MLTIKNIVSSSLVVRLISFLTLFILQSGIIGSFVIGTRLLYPFYFFLYGNLGKLVLFSIVAFAFYAKEKVFTVPLAKYDMKNLWFIGVGLVSIPFFFYLARNLLSYHSFTSHIPLFLLTHLVLISGSICFLLGTFGLSFLIHFSRQFKKEITMSVILAIVYDLAIFYIWNFWPYFSFLVLHAVSFLFSYTFPTVIFPPFGLFVKSFTVQIEAACSGLDSLFLFTSLYLLIGLFDRQTLKKTTYFLLFFPSVVGLFLVNILRVYLLIWVGIFFNPRLTLQLFHTYIGMVLFILYFLAFMNITYRWMRK